MVFLLLKSWFCESFYGLRIFIASMWVMDLVDARRRHTFGAVVLCAWYIVSSAHALVSHAHHSSLVQFKVSIWRPPCSYVHIYVVNFSRIVSSFITKTESYTVHTTNGQTSQPSCTLTYSLKERTHNGNGKTVKMLIFSRHNNMLDCSTFSALYKFNLQYELRTHGFPLIYPVYVNSSSSSSSSLHIQMVTYRPYPSSDGHRRQMPCSTSK